MGNTKSVALHKDIFKTELKKLNDIINHVVSKNDQEFNLRRYNVAQREVCESYNMILSSQLKKHLKVELMALKDAIYIVPDVEKLELKDTFFTKQELCDMVAKHYNKILRLLVTIKYVYDLESNGDSSIAGITLLNIRKNGNIFEIRYCDSPQHFISGSLIPNKLDFNTLVGFKYYCSEMLNTTEKNIFMRNIRNLLNRTDLSKMAQHMNCGDGLLSQSDYRDILINTTAKNVKCNPITMKYMKTFSETKNEHEHMDVAKNNPLFHESICTDKRQLLIDLSIKDKHKQKQHRHLLKLYAHMKEDYNKNINEIYNLINQLVKEENGGYVLKDIDAHTLDQIEMRVKRLIAKFYFQSLINFYNLLDFAKTITPTIVDWKDRLKDATGP